jgi:hypothetical protein
MWLSFIAAAPPVFERATCATYISWDPNEGHDKQRRISKQDVEQYHLCIQLSCTVRLRKKSSAYSLSSVPFIG